MKLYFLVIRTMFAIALTQFSLNTIGQRSDHHDRDTKFLLLDSRNVAATSNLTLELGKVVKHPLNPFFGPDQPWEHNYDNFYGNIIYDSQQQKYRLWYLNWIDGKNSLLYAESIDGIKWLKPALNLTEYSGSKRNNIIMMMPHGVGIIKDTIDPDPERRYKMISKHEGEEEWLQVSFSSDGIHWSDQLPQKKISATADTHNNAFWAPTLDRYVAITRQFSKWPYNDQTKGNRTSRLELERKGERQVARSESSNFVDWTRAEVVLEGLDPRKQPYAMPVFYYEGIYLGLVGTLERGESERVFTELTWSPDTYDWNRIKPGTSLVPNSEKKGDYDYGMLWACASPIIKDDSILIYYAGFDLPHAGKGRKGYLCLATIKKDAWAGYVSGNLEGTLLTTPKVYDGSKIAVTADINKGGSITVEMLDENKNVLNTSYPISGSKSGTILKWKQDLSSIKREKISLRFIITNSVLYAFEFRN